MAGQGKGLGAVAFGALETPRRTLAVIDGKIGQDGNLFGRYIYINLLSDFHQYTVY